MRFREAKVREERELKRHIKRMQVVGGILEETINEGKRGKWYLLLVSLCLFLLSSFFFASSMPPPSKTTTPTNLGNCKIGEM